MPIFIRKTNLNDAEKLWLIQKLAFQEDSEKYKDVPSPGNETLEQLKQKISEYEYFTILFDDTIIGGACIQKIDDRRYRLKRIYIDPGYQNKGYGFQVMTMIEELFPNALIWELDTPYLNFRNHHLYEKAGYIKVGENRISENFILFDYVKEIKHT